MENFRIEFGALCPPLVKQLELQGLEFTTKTEAEIAQKAADAMATLCIRSFLTHTERERVRSRIGKRVGRHLRRIVPAEKPRSDIEEVFNRR